MKLTIDDINRRKKGRVSKITEASRTPRVYTEKNIFCENNTVDAIQHWQELASDSTVAFDIALDLFCELCYNNSKTGLIEDQCNFLAENVTKVRDSVHLQNSIDHRNSHLRSRIDSKINKKVNTVGAAIQASIGNITNSLHSGLAAKAPAPSPAVGNSANQPQQTDDAKQEQVIDKCFNILSEKAKTVRECDRILENYAKINKRFNLDKVVEDIYTESDIMEAVLNITKYIDTYNIPFKNKYNCALETAYYVLNDHLIQYPNSKIAEAVTNYFIFSKQISDQDVIDIHDVMENSVIYEYDDFDNADCWQISVSDEESSIDAIDSYNFDGDFGVLAELSAKSEKKNELRRKKKEVKKDIKLVKNTVKKNVKKGNPEEHEAEEIKQMVDDFRKQCAKEPDKNKNIINLKAVVERIYTKDPGHIIDELPTLFGIIRTFFIISVTAFQPIIGLITLITDKIIQLTLTRKKMARVLEAYKKEYEEAGKKMEKAKTDEEKQRWEKYREELKKDYEKLHNHDMSNYSDEENDERDAWGNSSIGGDDDDDDFDFDFDFGDDDWGDIDIESAANTVAGVVITEKLLTSISEGLIEDMDGVVFNNIFKLDNNTIDTITDFSVTVPVVLEKDKLCKTLESYRDELRKNKNHTVEDYIRIDCLNENISKLKNNGRVYGNSTDMKSCMYYLAFLNEMVNIEGDENYIMEMNFTNNLKLAMNNLKKGALKLSDKEKQVSSSLDVSVSQVQKSIETAMMNNNREAVIKGRLIPSASKCIKIALGLGVAWAVNPAIAVITAIGGFICMKKMQTKERQLVLDDIEIEIKMCDRYIQKYEDEKDMEKLRQVEKIQRNLQRQQQRIKYKMHVESNSKVPTSATAKPMDSMGGSSDY